MSWNIKCSREIDSKTFNNFKNLSGKHTYVVNSIKLFIDNLNKSSNKEIYSDNIYGVYSKDVDSYYIIIKCKLLKFDHYFNSILNVINTNHKDKIKLLN